MLRLLELDPVRYSESVDKEKFEINSDDTWLTTSTDYKSVWITKDYDDSSWENAVIVPSVQNQFAALGVNPSAIWKGKAAVLPQGNSLTDTSAAAINDTLATVTAQDSLGNMTAMPADTMSNLSAAPTKSLADTSVFFRKSFNLNGKVVGGEIFVTADDDYRLYFNGEYLIDDADNKFSKVDTLDYYTFDRYVANGKNLISVDVLDKDLTGMGLKFYGYFELVPLDLASNAETETIKATSIVDPKRLKEINVLRKNRISIGQQ